MAHPFEFNVSAPTKIDSLRAWTDQIRRIEEMGFTAVVMADHFTDGYDLEPMVALTAAAGATKTLRLQTGVLGNDYRHPVLTARMAASLDVLSDGRFTLGLGAGWMKTDYEAAGITLDPAGKRVSRFEESVTVIRGLLSGGHFAHQGEFYSVDLELLPKCVQKPLPLFIGGGSPRVLGVAGKNAQVVGVLASLASGKIGPDAILDQSSDRVREKIGWVRAAAESVGRNFGDIHLEMNHWLVRVTSTRQEADALLEKVAARNGVDVAFLKDSPAVLVGTTEELKDTLQMRRETLGISCLQLDAGFAPADLDSLKPLVAALAGK